MVVNPIVQKLKQKSTQEVTLKDEKFGESKWIVRPLSTFELIENSTLFDTLPDDVKLDPENMDKKTYDTVKNQVLPMMKTFLPLCCVSPKVTTDFEDADLKKSDGDTVHLGDIPIKMASSLFNEILNVSGLTKVSEEERKKLPPVTSA